MKFLWRRILGFVERQASFSDDVFKDPIIWSYYWLGKCIVAIVEDLQAPKIVNTLIPLLFALRVVYDSTINSGFATKLIFLQK